MAQRSHVPQFGNWESGENVPYTAYFDKARKGRGGKIINPNDPHEYPDAFSDEMAPVRASPSQTSADPDVRTAMGVAASKPKHMRHLSGEDGEVRRSMDSPARNDVRRSMDSPARNDVRRSMDSSARNDVGGRRAVNDSPQRNVDRGGNYGNTPRAGTRFGGSSDRSIEQSPLHPHHQARAASKGGVNYPSWERKGSSDGGRSSHGHAPSVPARSKLRSLNDESPERGSAVPKFGDWDESNPASADGYTHIFNKVREEKQTGATKVPVMPTESSHNDHKKDSSQDLEPVKCWCFSFSKK